MAWERRRNGTYYYRSRKVGGRVVKEYIGAGRSADLAAAKDAADRANRAAASGARQAARGEIDAVDAPVDAFAGVLETLTRARLVLTGYHRHHGGEWRRRRDG